MPNLNVKLFDYFELFCRMVQMKKEGSSNLRVWLYGDNEQPFFLELMTKQQMPKWQMDSFAEMFNCFCCQRISLDQSDDLTRQ